MPPFAQKMMRQLLEMRNLPLPNSDMSQESADMVRSLMMTLLPRAAHFEISGIIPLVDEFAVNHFPHHVDPTLMFWPYPVLWFEWVNNDTGLRDAILVDAANSGSNGKAAVNFCRLDDRGEKPIFNFGKSYDFAPGEIPSSILKPELENMKTIHGSSALTAGILTLVNQPSGLERTAYSTHKGLARQLKNDGLLDGAELLPWHKITLGGPPTRTEASGLSGRAGHRKCYHFVRAHIRRANGQFVRHHWRGDPALGVGRKVYQVVA